MLDDSIQYNNRILLGEDSNNFENFIAPTLILSDKKKSKINSEEIFGPILPIVEYDNLDEAITWINNKTPPLSIYIFSNSKINIEKIAKLTKSGGIVINEVMLQFAHPNLPFGGVRESGIGRSHGFAGFKEFSIERSYLKAGKINPLKLFYPPFNEQKRKLIDLLIKYF
jgi:aldehyde dehydrogenase (NAD+)